MPSISLAQDNFGIKAVELLQQLIRFDTTNPPGNEQKCIEFIEILLNQSGCNTQILAQNPHRPNLVARIRGKGQAPPLLLYGHLDVVTTAHQEWSYPPFEGRRADGFIWGRGALDMKGGIAMMISALLRLIKQNIPTAGDIILALVSDEETGGDNGAAFLIKEYPEYFSGVKYGIGEFGGFSIPVGKQRLYPIMVAEKQICWLRASLKGPGGHGAIPMRGGAMEKLGAMLTRLDRHRLPAHITPLVHKMIKTMADPLPFPKRSIVKLLQFPLMADPMLRLLGEKGKTFDPLLHNTVNATMLRGGEAINVIPSEINVWLDGRLLPGFRPIDLIMELRELVGSHIRFEVERHDTGLDLPDLGMFPLLENILKELDPKAIPMPMLLPGATDGRHFAKLGIQTYGFLPMHLPEDFSFFKLIHAADERIPESALEFGTEAIYRVLLQYNGSF